MKFTIKSLGCKINQFDAGALRERLAAGGLSEAGCGEQADVSVIFTCTVTKKSDYQCRQEIRRLVKDKPEGGTVVVTGCYAQTAADEIKAIPGVDLVVGNDKKDSLPEMLLRAVHPSPSGHPREAWVGRRGAGGEGESKPSECWAAQAIGGRSRAFLKVQEGCESFCSYCIVPYARGKSRSANPEDVLAQADSLIGQGYHEIVLTGVHLGAYGADLRLGHSRENGIPEALTSWEDTRVLPYNTVGADLRVGPISGPRFRGGDGERMKLSGLLKALLDRPALGRLRLSSIEPMEIDDELLALFSHEKLCRHFHIPLQSAEAGVLKSMGRGYTPEQYFGLLEKIYKQTPDACIGADVIVGYPIENNESFVETYKRIEDSPLNHLHVFSYSPRKGTKAFALGDPLHGDEKKERSLRLRELAARKNRAFREGFVGRMMTVVAEEKENGASGLTDNYIRVAFDGKGFPPKAPVKVRIEEVMKDICKGRAI